MNLKLKRTPGIYVVGFTAAGKSTVGRHLAHKMGWSFFDIDHEIEGAEGIDLASLVAARGEAELRRIETEILRQHVRSIERGRPAVLALGSGAFVEWRNRNLLENNGISVWLDCPLETVKRRVADALTHDRTKFAALYDARREFYAKADLKIAIESDDPEITVAAILSHPLFR